MQWETRRFMRKQGRLHGNLRPAAARHTGDRVKLHRHVIRGGAERYTVITMRPGTNVRFSSNRYHGTWHILSDLRGARMLGRLLWGLAYQQVPRTLVLIGWPHLDPDPFDGSPADPIALVPSLLTPLPARAARELQKRFPLSRPEGTVRWHTPGLAAAAAARREERGGGFRGRRVPGISQHYLRRIGGLLVFAATPTVLREWAVDVHGLGEHLHHGMDYAELGWLDGEVQVFTDYQQRVSTSRVARREVLARLPRPVRPDDLEPLIWQRAAEIRDSRRHQARPGR
jgi:hypothetical protein